MEDATFIVSWINALIVPTAIYRGVEVIAKGIFMYVTPVLLVIAIAVRTLEETLDITNSNGRWLNAVRDMIMIGLAITVYFAAGNMVNELFVALYSHFTQIGSIGSVTSQVADMIEQLETNTQDTGFVNWAVSGIYESVAKGAYYLSLITITAIIAFLHIAQALGYGLAFCWGLIALPMSVTRGLTLLKGWALFTAFILAWPIIESLAMGIVIHVFTDVSVTMTAGATGNTRVEQGSLLLAFTTLNIILAVVVVVVPFLTNGFISNSAVGRDFVVPFVAGALAQVAAVKRAGGGVARAATSTTKNVILGAADGVKASVPLYQPKPGSKGKGSAPLSASRTLGNASGNNAKSKHSPVDANTRQARRGAIISQNKAKSKAK